MSPIIPTSKRTLKHSKNSYGALSQNLAHQLAADHALRLYSTNAIYSFIPKNACSTLRLSFALANGCIASKKDFNWIHKNNLTFKADLASLAMADYTFVVLRCPFARLASVYLDKIVDRSLVAWHFLDLIRRESDIDEITFDSFITSLSNPIVRRSDIHWRPQIDFLIYEQYDDYFCLEEFAKATEVLKNKINLTVVDARALTKHGINSLELVSHKSFAHTLPTEIREMKISGRCPDPKALYTDKLISVVRKYYGADISLYQDLFGVQELMFSNE